MTPSPLRVRVRSVAQDPDHLEVVWEDGHRSRFDVLWLRDARPEDRDPGNGQHLVDVTELPTDCRLTAARAEPDGSVVVEWAGDPPVSGRFEAAWLREHDAEDSNPAPHHPRPTPWRSDRPVPLAYAEFADVAGSDRYLARWLRLIRDEGIGFLRGVPAEPGRIYDVVRLFGFVRETNYGRLFDVKAVDRPNNLAYTDRGLPPHTDNPYRDPVPGLQALHCLRPAPEGGESLFVDGFAAADDLRRSDPAAYELLAGTPVRFTFRDEENLLTAERPIVQLDRQGNPASIHVNHRSMMPPVLPLDRTRAFYRAYLALAGRLASPEFVQRVRLESGDLVVFDNQRILHGRTAFRGQAGGRHLQGCYVDRDGLLSRLAILEARLGEGDDDVAAHESERKS